MSNLHELTLLSQDSTTGFQTIHVESTTTPEIGFPSEWSVRSHTLRGGLQEGVSVVEINNGRLSFAVLPTRGMGIWKGRCGSIELGWDSPVKQPVNPQFMNEQDRGGLGWLKGFNEWFVRCGLNNMGAPGIDTVLDYSGNAFEVPLTLHGKIANIPAHAVVLTVTENEIVLRGEVDETMMFGPALRLTTEIRTEMGSGSLTITDTVTNLGDNPVEHQMLYHINYGANLLEEGSRILAPFKQVAPRDPRSEEGIDTFDEYGAPQIGFVEQAYLYELVGNDSNDETVVMLHNAAADKATVLRYSLNDFPCFTQWKNTAGLKDGYVTGLEPATNYPNSRRFEREKGRVISMAGGESRKTAITIEMLESTEEVESAIKEVQSLQATAEGKIQPKAVAHLSA